VKNFLLKLNWRLILIHFLASYLFILAFREFAYALHDYHYLHKSLYNYVHHNKYPSDVSRFMDDINFIAYAGAIGVLPGFMISLGIAIKKHWFWLNSVLVFIATLALVRFAPKIRLGYYLSYIYFDRLTSQAEGIINGIIMLSLAFALLFSKYTIKFIDKGVYKTSSPNLGEPILNEENS
jgi:hypothetical protein